LRHFRFQLDNLHHQIQFYNIPEDVLEGCFYLTQYAVIVRYPHELFVEDKNVSRAVYYMNTICCFAKSELAKIDDCNEAKIESKNSNLTNPE
ncbi:MAG: hypothetical protein J6Y01_02085, partial [Spirochaetales bacterium]|nr:hypothetical protein [Spirochaetales bacterium]